MRQPVVFISHGAPMVALEEDEAYARALRRFGQRTPRPVGVAVVSAHWEADWPARVTASARPPVLYDFSGFPDPLYRMSYKAPGDPALAGRIVAALQEAGLPAAADPARGWDHGVWIPMRLTYPEADVPLVQISLPRPSTPEDLLRLGRALKPLRDRGVMLVGSGGIVHNLRRIRLDAKDAPPDAWAVAFDAWVAERVARLDTQGILAYRGVAPHADPAVPTTEHFDPIFIVLGAASADDRFVPIHDGIQYGNLSMRSFACSPS
jgi:4,5-DOPA dioxygenase extradiol